MPIEVFNRTEKKFIITDEVYRAIKQQLGEYMELDAYSRNGDFYTICNVYYDTPDHVLIQKSIENPIYKEKLRLRSYGTVGQKDRVYLEIKKKCNGQVNKRRTSMYLEEAYNYIAGQSRPVAKRPFGEQILNEIDYFLIRYPDLEPKLFISYDRNAMFGIENPNFRITFDTNIRTRRKNVGLELGNYGELLLPAGEWVMEVKMNNAAPLWFAKLLSSYQIYPTTFSKYGTEYRRALERGEVYPTRTGNEIKLCV
ncbi:MAG: hypothetical protein H6Q59_8 [Firmicutes bacterium]|nr:hypothetical protein [Bacillota bacterium]